VKRKVELVSGRQMGECLKIETGRFHVLHVRNLSLVGHFFSLALRTTLQGCTLPTRRICAKDLIDGLERKNMTRDISKAAKPEAAVVAPEGTSFFRAVNFERYAVRCLHSRAVMFFSTCGCF